MTNKSFKENHQSKESRLRHNQKKTHEFIESKYEYLIDLILYLHFHMCSRFQVVYNDNINRNSMIFEKEIKEGNVIRRVQKYAFFLIVFL